MAKREAIQEFFGGKGAAEQVYLAHAIAVNIILPKAADQKLLIGPVSLCVDAADILHHFAEGHRLLILDDSCCGTTWMETVLEGVINM